MLSREDNELLCRTGPGTPMGELFRRFWLPAMLASDLPGPDSEPWRLQILGERLVAFRDTNGEGRHPGSALPASAGRPVVRPERGERADLRLPRLEVRRRGQHGQHADRTGRQRLQGALEDQELSGQGVRRGGVGLHGAQGAGAGAPAVRVGANCRRPAVHSELDAGIELYAGGRGRDRLGSRELQPPLVQSR